MEKRAEAHNDGLFAQLQYTWAHLEDVTLEDQSRLTDAVHRKLGSNILTLRDILAVEARIEALRILPMVIVDARESLKDNPNFPSRAILVPSSTGVTQRYLYVVQFGTFEIKKPGQDPSSLHVLTQLAGSTEEEYVGARSLLLDAINIRLGQIGFSQIPPILI